ncbi:MAG: hypothetical protein WBQ66_20060 [Blastocatellia bacterium]
MKIIKFVLGTIVSIVALALATKIAAFILGIVGFTLALVFLALKLALILGIVALIIWAVSRLLSSKSQSETI